VIGVLWALIRSFLTMLVFTIAFGHIAKLPSDGTAPYALMVFAGMLPWTFFSTGLAEASSSLISNANLIGKVSVSQPFSSGSASAVSEKWKAASPPDLT
jgi:lipopolysaccharide transport system permease protein